MKIKAPAVAGTFYPLDARELAHTVETHLQQNPCQGPAPKILVVPHAGLIYSGPIAARGYNTVVPIRHDIQRVVVLGPNHRVALRGIASLSADYFATPLGNVSVDRDAIECLLKQQLISENDVAHRQEHCIEVQLPFLQSVLPHFKLIPLLVGQCSPLLISSLLQALDDEHTLFVISTDLSHYQSYQQARATDKHTLDKILHLDSTLEGEEACGCQALNGALLFAQHHQYQAELLDIRNSGDTAGDHSRVVGYASLSIH
ncbi:MAG: AmmeMemoRadiSam system protein B [Pseudomonadota bacterium]